MDKILTPEVEAEFTTTAKTTKVFYRNNSVDLSKITLKTAQNLVADGFPYLVAKPKKEKKKPEEEVN